MRPKQNPIFPTALLNVGSIVDAAEKDDYNMLAELILLGMYTGCRINELCSLKIEDIGPDYFQIQTGKTEGSTRRLPIHSDIKQLVERLVQNSSDGYLLSVLSCSNSDGNRSKAISKKFGHHKRAMGFGEVHTFHSFRATLITRMINVEADSILAKKTRWS